MSVDGAGNGPQFNLIQGGQAGRPAPVPPGYGQAPNAPLPEDNAAVRASVRLAAGAHQSFESALLGMVEAAGVTEPRASAVAEAILANDELRAQAQRAFEGSRLGSV